MRLSEAIREGARRRPNQAFLVLFDRDQNATCAIGAAADAVGILDTTHPNAFTGPPPEEWRQVGTRPVVCPCCGWLFMKLDRCIIHLNNEPRWTREQIADFVEAQERIEAPGSAPAVRLSTGEPIVTIREKELSSS